MATYMALGGIATASWYELQNFEFWKDLEDSNKKTWCINLNPSDTIAQQLRLFNVKRVTYKNTLWNSKN